MQGIVAYRLCRKARYEFLVLERFQRKLVAGLLIVVIARHVGYLAFRHLELDVGSIVHTLVFHIGVRIVYALDIGGRDDICTEDIGCKRYDRGAYQIGPQQTPVTHAGGQHGYNLRIVGQLGCKEDDRYECEQRAELVGKVRQKVEKVIEYRGPERGFEKGIELLIYVKHYRDSEYERYRENVGSEELANYVPVKYLHGVTAVRDDV